MSVFHGFIVNMVYIYNAWKRKNMIGGCRRKWEYLF